MLYTPFLASNQAQLYAKCDHILDSDDKLIVISLMLEIFRRLNAISIAFHTPNDMHDNFSVETIQTVRKMRPFTRFWRKLCVVSVLLEIFVYLNAISIAFYTPSAMHAVFSVESSPTPRKMRPFTRFWRQTERYFAIVGDISTIKRYFHCISHAECYACRFYRRIKPNCAQNATIYTILKKTVRYIGPAGDISPFNRYFHRILHAECYARRF